MSLPLEPPLMAENTDRVVTAIHFTGHKTSLDEETLVRIHGQLLALANEPSESDVFLDFSRSA